MIQSSLLFSQNNQQVNPKQNTQDSVGDWSVLDRLRLRLASLWNYGLEPSKQIILQVRWPLYFIPLVLLNQLLTPHPVWITLLIVLAGLYGFSYWWIRLLAKPGVIDLQRTHQGTVLVAEKTPLFCKFSKAWFMRGSVPSMSN